MHKNIKTYILAFDHTIPYRVNLYIHQQYQYTLSMSIMKVLWLEFLIVW